MRKILILTASVTALLATSVLAQAQNQPTGSTSGSRGGVEIPKRADGGVIAAPTAPAAPSTGSTSGSKSGNDAPAVAGSGVSKGAGEKPCIPTGSTSGAKSGCEAAPK